jgi:hypothetical protein
MAANISVALSVANAVVIKYPTPVVEPRTGATLLQ